MDEVLLSGGSSWQLEVTAGSWRWSFGHEVLLFMDEVLLRESFPSEFKEISSIKFSFSLLLFPIS